MWVAIKELPIRLVILIVDVDEKKHKQSQLR